MERAYGLSIPRTLAEACDPARTAVLVYDLQVGVVSQVAGGAEIVERAARVIDAARAGGYRVLYCRHVFLPLKLAGVNALRTAMMWQRTDRVDELQPFLTPGSPGAELVPELRPDDDELVFDKVTMSAFEGTPLDIVLRDCHIDTLVVVGIATEIGIEPTVRHALDLGYLPILPVDACGHGDADAARRSLETLRFTGGTLFTDTDELTALLRG